MTDASSASYTGAGVGEAVGAAVVGAGVGAVLAGAAVGSDTVGAAVGASVGGSVSAVGDEVGLAVTVMQSAMPVPTRQRWS